MKKYFIITNKYTVRERITGNGKVYDIIFRVIQAVDGITKQKSLCGFQTKAKAKLAYMEWIQKNCSTEARPTPQKKVGTTKKDPTVSELIAQYIVSLQNQNKESSIYCKKKALDTWINPKIGSVCIKDLTKEKLQILQDEIWSSKNPKTKEFYTYKYLCNIRMHLSAFLNWVEERYGYTNNLKFIKKPKNLQAKRIISDVWTKEEFNSFLACVSTQRYKTYFAMLFYTGRRKSEILALTPDDVKNGSITINKTYSRKTLTDKPFTITANKNTKSGISYIPPDLQREIDRYTPESPFYFGGSSPISEHAIQNAFDQAVRKSGVKRIRIHDLRHSFVSRLIHLGASPYVVADLIGDNVEQIYKTYGHLYEKDKLDILKKL